MVKLSLCLTNYNRDEMLFESYANVINDGRIDEIIIVDDCSHMGYFQNVQSRVEGNPKIKLFRNPNNIGMSLNKKRAVEFASNPWCILFDSDNIIKPDYLDALERVNFHDQVIYMPDFAMPKFDFRAYKARLYDKQWAKRMIKEPMFNVCMNTCNYVVNRTKYIEAYRYNPEMIASDTVWFNYNWLKGGGEFYVVPGMSYFHRVHDGSGYMEDLNNNMRKSEYVRKLILEMK